MAIVIEVLDKKGDVSRYHRCDSESIKIGRSYDNNVTLLDPYVDELHLEIVANEDGTFRVIDQGSVNSVQLHRKSSAKSHMLSVLDICSGDEVSLGQSRIRVVDSTVPMAIAKKQLPEHKLSKLSKHPASLVSLLVLTLLVLMYDKYADTIIETTFSDYLISLFQVGALLLFASLVLSLVAKAIRHQWYFLQNVFNVCVFVLVVDCSSMLFDIIYFNVGFWQEKWLLDALALFILMLLAGWVFTFNLFAEKRNLRLASVFSFALLVFAYSVIHGLADERDITKVRPMITDRFSSWVMPFQPRLTDAEFIEKSVTTFDKIKIDEQ